MCNAQGLVGKSLFAIDGCKLPSDASKEWSGTRADFERKAAKMERAVAHLVKAHADQDASEALDPNEDTQRVGWAERSDAQHRRAVMLGFAGSPQSTHCQAEYGSAK